MTQNHDDPTAIGGARAAIATALRVTRHFFGWTRLRNARVPRRLTLFISGWLLLLVGGLGFLSLGCGKSSDAPGEGGLTKGEGLLHRPDLRASHLRRLRERVLQGRGAGRR